MTSRVIQDDDLHVCIFNKDFTRLESYFKIEILVKIRSPHELSFKVHMTRNFFFLFLVVGYL